MCYFPVQRVNKYFKNSIHKTWHLSGLFDMIGTVYIYVIVGSFLQFYCFDTSEPKKSCYLNYILFSISTILSVAFPFILMCIFSNELNNKDN